MEITKVVKPVHKKGVTQYFWQYSVYAAYQLYLCPVNGYRQQSG